jgi:hypothetical protein
VIMMVLNIVSDTIVQYVASILTVRIDSNSAVCQCVHAAYACDGRWLDWQQLINEQIQQ